MMPWFGSLSLCLSLSFSLSLPLSLSLGSTGVLTQGLTLARQELYQLSHSNSPVFVLVFSEIGSCDHLSKLDLSHNSPNLCLITDMSHWCPPGHALDLQCPPKVHMLKAWLTACGITEKW
jgi:hypothetical protein